MTKPKTTARKAQRTRSSIMAPKPETADVVEEVVTKSAKRTSIIGDSAKAIIKEVDRTKAAEIAKAIFDGTKKEGCIFPDFSTLKATLREAVKSAYKAQGKPYPRSGTQGYFNLDNTLRSIVRTYGEYAKWKKDDETDGAWDYKSAAEKVIKKHTADEVKAYIKVLQDTIGNG